LNILYIEHNDNLERSNPEGNDNMWKIELSLVFKMMMMNGYVKPAHNKKWDSSLFSFENAYRQELASTMTTTFLFFRDFYPNNTFSSCSFFFLFIYLMFVHSVDERKIRVSAWAIEENGKENERWNLSN
jgi:hypothetical protein